MKKIQAADEAGRAMALKRYGSPDGKSGHGHSQMHRNVRGKFEMADGGLVDGSQMQGQAQQPKIDQSGLTDAPSKKDK